MRHDCDLPGEITRWPSMWRCDGAPSPLTDAAAHGKETYKADSYGTVPIHR